MNDLWIELFLFFLVVDRPESVMNLINSEDCEYEFEKIIKDAECIESEEFKSKILEYLNDKKDKILELNDIYKKHSVGWSVKEDGERVVEEVGCEDCISRTEALKVIEEQKKGFYGVERYAIDECHSAVMKLPSVTPKQKVGKWKVYEYGHFFDYNKTESKILICSECETQFLSNREQFIEWANYNIHYCPNCGAKMEVEK